MNPTILLLAISWQWCKHAGAAGRRVYTLFVFVCMRARIRTAFCKWACYMMSLPGDGETEYSQVMVRCAKFSILIFYLVIWLDLIDILNILIFEWCHVFMFPSFHLCSLPTTTSLTLKTTTRSPVCATHQIVRNGWINSPIVTCAFLR